MSANCILEYIHALKKSQPLGAQVAAHDLQTPISGELRNISDSCPRSSRKLLRTVGINHLYSHQQAAIDAIRAGEHVVVSTPTASGKSLIYNLSVFESYLNDPSTRLTDSAIDLIARCKCDQGCPACIHSPKCGSGNHPMDKAGARYLLENMRKSGEKDGPVNEIETVHAPKSASLPEPAALDINFGVFDLETQRSAKEVGGWHKAHKMKISCGVVYDANSDDYKVYMEDQVDQLIEHLQRFDAVVGFNSKRFDYKVLSRYSDFNFSNLPSIDLLELVYNQLGFRLSLDHLAKQTLNLNKSGSGLDALKWWKSGQIVKIIEYCTMDVRITLDLFLHLRKKGYLIYQQKSGERFRIPINIAPW